MGILTDVNWSVVGCESLLIVQGCQIVFPGAEIYTMQNDHLYGIVLYKQCYYYYYYYYYYDTLVMILIPAGSQNTWNNAWEAMVKHQQKK